MSRELELSDFIQMVLNTFSFLETQEDLSPGNHELNTVLGSFVGAVLDLSGDDEKLRALEDSRVRNIRAPMLQKLAEAEFHMERYFAEMFSKQQSLSLPDLDQFWYRDCYHKLAQFEIEAMHKTVSEKDKPLKMAFVGSGPLPLTGIDMYLQKGCDMLCVDCDQEAATLSRSLVEKLGLSQKISVVQRDGCEQDYSGCDVVLIAALVPEKEKVVRRVRETAPDAVIGIRSVQRLKALLYEPVSIEFAADHGLDYSCTSRDARKTINTTHFFKPASMNCRAEAAATTVSFETGKPEDSL